MSTSIRTLERPHLRLDLQQHEFLDTPRPHESFGVEIEVFPLHWRAGESIPTVVPLRPRRPGELSSIERVQTFAQHNRIGVRMPESVSTHCGDRFSFEPGGQIEYSSSPQGSPAAAYAEAAAVLDQLSVYLARDGIDMVTLGCNPWNDVEEIGLQVEGARYVCMDAFFASIGEAGQRMMRQTATIHVNVDLGSSLRAGLRWQAAQLVAPIAHAIFACSPVIEGRSTSFRSYRGSIWNQTDASRSGFPPSFMQDPEGDPVEHYLDFALDARVMLVREDQVWRPMTEPLTFADWMEHGVRRRFPDLDDWHFHLTTLFPEVRPKGFLELRSADSQFRAFWSVPLTFWSALLCSDLALSKILDRLTPTSMELRQRWRRAAQDGLSDPDLSSDAKFLFGLAADSLLTFPAGFYSAEMKRSFVAFGDRFTLRGRSPADELVELYLEQGLDRAAWRGLHDAWCALAGVTPATV